MANDSQLKISRNLRRQRRRLVNLLVALDDKNLGKQRHNAALEKRRRYYQLKNNRRGRPAKKPQLVSKEDQARRVQYVAEITLLNEAIESNPANADRFLDWLAILRDEKGEGEAWRARQRKIEQLLGQFGVKPAKAPVPERKWNHNEVRNYVTLLRDRQMGWVRAFDRLSVATVGEQDKEDAARAKLAVLERFCTSHHLATADMFRWRAHLIRRDVIYVGKPHDRAVYREAWFNEVDKIVNTLISRYGAS